MLLGVLYDAWEWVEDIMQRDMFNLPKDRLCFARLTRLVYAIL